MLATPRRSMNPRRSGTARHVVSALLVILFGPTCSSPPSREEKAVALLERMADAFERHGDSDCDALAAALDDASTDEDALLALSEVDRTDASRRRLAKLQQRIDDATAKIVDHAKKCGADPRVSRALAAVLGAG
jgi:hypothetical protein